MSNAALARRLREAAEHDVPHASYIGRLMREAAALLDRDYVMVPRTALQSIQFSDKGYCPACAGWEQEKGRGCKPKVHNKTCWLGKLLA